MRYPQWAQLIIKAEDYKSARKQLTTLFNNLPNKKRKKYGTSYAWGQNFIMVQRAPTTITEGGSVQYQTSGSFTVYDLAPPTKRTDKAMRFSFYSTMDSKLQCDSQLVAQDDPEINNLKQHLNIK